MKLRLRNYESKETQRIQVPSPCSFLQLQETLFLSLPPPQPSLYFSLNAKDLLFPPSPQSSLQSLGVTGGDLIYFSLNPNAFSSTQDPQSVTLIQDPNQMEELSNNNQDTPFQSVTLVQDPNPMSESNNNNQDTRVQESSQFQEPISEEPESEFVEVDSSALSERLSEPYFLRKVLGQELGDNGSIHKRMAIAVHAVLLESGFVGFDPVSGLQTDRFHVPDESPSPLALCYSLPELLRDGSNLTDYVVLKFHTLGQFFQVYGSLVKGSGLHRLSLDESRFAKTLDLVWANSANNDDKDESFNSNTENEVFEFWKIVKDGLALPLLIDLCYKTGLDLPACMIRLPTDLKLKIIESLHGADIARMECLCSEMRYLASNNDLWKLKFEEEFGGTSGAGALPVWNWKSLFCSFWLAQKKHDLAITRRQGPRYIPIWRDPNPIHPFGQPHIIGGDFDAFPFGLPHMFGSPRLVPHPFVAHPHQHPVHRFRLRRSFGPPCNHRAGQNDAQ